MKVETMILVTGGAGFVGTNFVLDWLGQTDGLPAWQEGVNRMLAEIL